MDIDKSYLVMRYLDAEQPSFIFFIRNQSNNHFYLPSIGAMVYNENLEPGMNYVVKTKYSTSFKEAFLARTEEKKEAVKLAFQAAFNMQNFLLPLFHLKSNHFLNETGMEIEIPPVKKRRSRLEKQIDSYLPLR